MNALALYNLKTVPKQEVVVEKKRPAKRPRIQSFALDSVEYICINCGHKVTLSSTDLVQCNHCDNRVVAKVQGKETRTYEAV